MSPSKECGAERVDFLEIALCFQDQINAYIYEYNGECGYRLNGYHVGFCIWIS